MQANNSLERTGGAVAEASDNPSTGSWKSIGGSDPRPLSSQPLGTTGGIDSVAESKTQKNNASVDDFLNSVPHERKRQDSFAIVRLMSEATGEEPMMWGTNIVGFGSYRYKYASGREGESPLTAFSPRKQNLTLYIMSGIENYGALLSDLGKHKTGKVCLYINKLEDIDVPALRKLVKQSVADVAEANQ